ncbi:hypothetical protein AX16_001295 [Volvariella volvacea WC 439]|nr:hypothetical protein AX16_001295 [Volvariella volvacea WC 439]
MISAALKTLFALWLTLASVTISSLATDPTTPSTVAVVNLLIDGPTTGTRPLFSGLVRTTGHPIRTAKGGLHQCDGTNGGANRTPGPTPNSALDDAARLNGFTYDGAFFPEFDDFLIDRIGRVSNTNTTFWQIFLNGRPIQVGGCQQQVKDRDQIHYAFLPFEEH